MKPQNDVEAKDFQVEVVNIDSIEYVMAAKEDGKGKQDTAGRPLVVQDQSDRAHAIFSFYYDSTDGTRKTFAMAGGIHYSKEKVAARLQTEFDKWIKIREAQKNELPLGWSESAAWGNTLEAFLNTFLIATGASAVLVGVVGALFGAAVFMGVMSTMGLMMVMGMCATGGAKAGAEIAVAIGASIGLAIGAVIGVVVGVSVGAAVAIASYGKLKSEVLKEMSGSPDKRYKQFFESCQTGYYLSKRDDKGNLECPKEVEAKALANTRTLTDDE